MVKKIEDSCNRLDTIPACDGQTDGQINILPRHSPRYAYASRGKNSTELNDPIEFSFPLCIEIYFSICSVSCLEIFALIQ